jgi:uncharacterized protein (TIGR02145 family)
MKTNNIIIFCHIVLFLLVVFLSISCEKNKDEESTVRDIDGNVYHTVTVGNQVWMVENLKTKHYNDGTEIPEGTSVGDYSSEISPEYWFAYDDNMANVDTFGRLYTWYVVNSSHNICPKGWHIPSDSEWNELQLELGMNNIDITLICDETNAIGGKLKEAGIIHWLFPNTGATDEYGFNALPAGYRRRYYKEFSYKGEYACFWTSTESFDSYAWYRSMYYNSANICRTYNFKNYGFSIRCIKD